MLDLTTPLEMTRDETSYLPRPRIKIWKIFPILSIKGCIFHFWRKQMQPKNENNKLNTKNCTYFFPKSRKPFTTTFTEHPRTENDTHTHSHRFSFFFYCARYLVEKYHSNNTWKRKRPNWVRWKQQQRNIFICM